VPVDALVPGLEPPMRTSRWGDIPPAVLRLILVAFLALVAFAGFEATFALLVEDRLNLTLASTAGVFTAIGLALCFVQVGLIHAISEKLGELGTLRLGLMSNACGLLLLAVDGGWLTLIPALLLLVFGQGLITPTMSSAVAGQVGPERRGQMLGFQQSAGSFARVIGPALAGVLFQHVGVPAPYVVGGVLVVIALLLVPIGAKATARPTVVTRR
jgi:DHA1 family tetracycline resistance protein-like MFS transporter